MFRIAKPMSLAFLAALTLLPLPSRACEECQLNKAGTFLGKFTLLGNGTARSWITLDKQGKPTAIGVTLSETALTGLSDTPKPGMVGIEYLLPLPKEAAGSGFNHVSLDWNPKGHVPPGIYDAPHFDVHFYGITPKARERITLKGEDAARCVRPLPAKFVPAGYILPPGTAEPGMGAHWIDPAAPEFNKQPFTKTFLFGSYDGELIFWEPMVTKAYLETKPNFSEPIKLPQAYQKPGYYPTRYAIRHDTVRQEYTIALEGLTWRGGVPNAKTAAKSRPPAVKAAAVRK